MIKLISKLGLAIVALSLLSANSLSNASEENQKAKIISVVNPAHSYGIQIGDKLTRSIVMDLPSTLRIEDGGFPKKGSKNNGVELVAIDVETETQKEITRYKVSLSYQSFVSPSKPTIMQLPVEKFSITGASKSMTVDVPSWGFWLSPIVTGNIATAKSNIQPEATPPLVDIIANKTRLAIFTSLLIASLVGLLYLNADGRWLPFMGGPFALAYRQLKRLAKTKNLKTVTEEKQALVYIHQAFNQHYGANMFGKDIEAFVSKQSKFKKLRKEISQFFDESNQFLYKTEPRDSKKIIANLVLLGKQLRDCERGA